MGLNRNKRLIALVLLIPIVFIVVWYFSIMQTYKEVRSGSDYRNFSRAMPPFHSSIDNIKFLVEGDSEVKINAWWSGITGDVEIKLLDDNDEEIHVLKDKGQLAIKLDEGVYNLVVKQRSFTGALALGYENMIIINELDKRNYTTYNSNPSKNIYWDYILYIPDDILNDKLLVVPNNTGIETDNYMVHREKAKSVIRSKSILADELGVPLLVPVFPRPQNDSDTYSLYTHALDRNSLLTDISELKRLDDQLINMIVDVKEVLLEKGIAIDEKILMSGFSASGDFVDRFTYLHPDLVEAMSVGGCATILPLSELRGQKLPYPIGTYDYTEFTGKDFDLNVFKDIPRFIYKGENDKGGWMLSQEDGGELIKYTWEEYYEKYELPDLSKQLSSAIMIKGRISEPDFRVINYKAFDGKILVDRFREISSLYLDKGITKTKFKVYDEIGHEITTEIRNDELEFFKEVLSK